MEVAYGGRECLTQFYFFLVNIFHYTFSILHWILPCMAQVFTPVLGLSPYVPCTPPFLSSGQVNPETINIVFEVWTFKSKILREVKKTSSSQGFPSWLLHKEGPNVTMLRLALQRVFSLKIEKSRSGTITRDKTSGRPWGLLVWQLLAFGFFQSGFPLPSHSNTEEAMSPSQSFILLFLLSSFFEWISLDSPRFCFFFFFKSLSSHFQLLPHKLDTGCEVFPSLDLSLCPSVWWKCTVES